MSCHACPVRSPSLCEYGKLLSSTGPNQKRLRNEGSTDESKKRLGCYQQEQFNLPREYSFCDSLQCVVNNRKLKIRRRRESQISNSLTRQNNNFARASRFFVHFFAVNCTTARLPVKMCNFMFCEGRNRFTDEKLGTLSNLDDEPSGRRPEVFSRRRQLLRMSVMSSTWRSGRDIC